MYIPTCFYNPSLINLIDSLIDDGYKSYCSLSDAERDRVITLCIDALGDDAYSCIIDSDHMIPDFKRYVLSCKHEDAVKLARHLHEAAVIYFSETMRNLFDERVNCHTSFSNIENNMFPHVDKNTGDIEWRRSA